MSQCSGRRAETVGETGGTGDSDSARPQCQRSVLRRDYPEVMTCAVALMRRREVTDARPHRAAR